MCGDWTATTGMAQVGPSNRTGGGRPQSWNAIQHDKKARSAEPDGERRDALIKVLATPDEREAFQVAADASGMSLSTWIRHIAIKAAKNARD